MARKTSTVYSCDRCGVIVERPRDLRRYDLSTPKPMYQSVIFEFCASCDGEFLDWLSEAAEDVVESLRREP